MAIHYCVSCVMPDTRPDLHFDDAGVCDACSSFKRRSEVDWMERREQLLTILNRYRSKDGRNYDCIVPVSGGKDSTFQVLKMLELDLKPLCVVATTCSFSELGRRNLENLKRLGCDVLEYSTNPAVRSQLNQFGLTQVGDISWPEHVSIFTIPVRIAAQMKIPLIIWGENPQNEYGGPAANRESHVLDRRWMEEFAGLQGLRVSDIAEEMDLSYRDLVAYTYPSDETLKSTGVTGLFLGYFLPWDGYNNLLVSQANGFEAFPHAVEGHLVNYENLDNYQAGIHEYFMYLKYGFGRAASQACLQIRRGRLAREDAIRIVSERDGLFPWSYLDRPLQEILAEIDLSIEEFVKICDRFTNKKLFHTDNDGRLIKREDGSLIKLNYDNE